MFFFREPGDRRPQAQLPRFETLSEAYSYQFDCDMARSEIAAEQAAERFYEEGTESQRMQYQWEVEQDERNARFFSGSPF
jgi:hypothetical protein